jgi:hypothetical protein
LIAAVLLLFTSPPTSSQELRPCKSEREAFRGMVDSAGEWIVKALADQPRDPEVYLHALQLCKDASCPQEQARKLLARSLELSPGYDGAYVDMANYFFRAGTVRRKPSRPWRGKRRAAVKRSEMSCTPASLRLPRTVRPDSGERL